MNRLTWLVLAVVGAALAIVGIESFLALAICLMEGLIALLAVGLGSLSGVWIVRALALSAPRLTDRLIAGSALGVGILSLSAFALGSAGLLTRSSAAALVLALSAAGIAALIVEIRPAVAQRPRMQPLHWLWLVVVPFLAIAMLSACLPPGVLWKDEGFGYDVLEYHLAVPKAYYTAGRITFLPNNVYASFPLNGEMLSLLMMHLRGNPIEACFMAVFVNIGLAGLFVAASAWAGAAFGRASGLIAGIVAAVTPWLTYLSGIAYVEPGMLATGMAGFALLLHAIRGSGGTTLWRAALGAGLLAGVSCGFKYTAVPMIAFPLAFIPLMARDAWRDRIRAALIYGLAGFVAFSPWLIRNWISTRNPVFPLAYSVFGARAEVWDDGMEAVWQHAHSSSQAEQNVEPIWQRVLERTMAEPLTGPLVLVLAAVGALRRRDRWTLLLLAIIAWQLVFWMAATHLFARFITVALLPLLILASRSVEPDEPAGSATPGPASLRLPAAPVVLVGLLIGAGINLYRISSLYYSHTRVGGVSLAAYGHTEWFSGVAGALISESTWPGAETWAAINALTSASARTTTQPAPRVMLVGEARTYYLLTPCDYAVVFNRHPLSEAVQQNPEPKAVLAWLRSHGFTHVLAHWSEMSRLLQSYGFYANLTPELFGSLEEAGLQRVSDYALTAGDVPYATLYEVSVP